MKQRRSGGAQYLRYGTSPNAARFHACGQFDRNVVQYYAPRGITHKPRSADDGLYLQDANTATSMAKEPATRQIDMIYRSTIFRQHRQHGLQLHSYPQGPNQYTSTKDSNVRGQDFKQRDLERSRRREGKLAVYPASSADERIYSLGPQNPGDWTGVSTWECQVC